MLLNFLELRFPAFEVVTVTFFQSMVGNIKWGGLEEEPGWVTGTEYVLYKGPSPAWCRESGVPPLPHGLCRPLGFSQMQRWDGPVPGRSSKAVQGDRERGDEIKHHCWLWMVFLLKLTKHSWALRAVSRPLSPERESMEVGWAGSFAEGVPDPSGPIPGLGSCLYRWLINVHWNQLFLLRSPIPLVTKGSGPVSMQRCPGMVSLRGRRAQWPRAPALEADHPGIYSPAQALATYVTWSHDFTAELRFLRLTVR